MIYYIIEHIKDRNHAPKSPAAGARDVSGVGDAAATPAGAGSSGAEAWRESLDCSGA